MQKDAYYFPHFSNARNDRRIKRVRFELQIEGYGIYFMLLELLREQDEYKYPIEDLDLIADDFGTSEQKIRAVVCNYGLFQIDEKECFFSLKFNEYMQPYLKMKEQRRVAGIASGIARKNKSLELPFNGRSTAVEQSKVKESKVKESKVKESKVKIPDYLKDIFPEFLRMRKLIKKPMSEKAIELLLKKLNTLSDDKNNQIKILERSIENSWQSVFPLPEYENNKPTNDNNIYPTYITSEQFRAQNAAE